VSGGFIADGLSQAASLIAAGDASVLSAVSVSLQVSAVAILVATALGVPLGYALATTRFPGRSLVTTLLNTLMALPTVVAGLLVYTLLARGSVLGPLDLLFSRAAIIIGEIVLALPIVAALTASAISALGERPRQAAVLLGASRTRATFTVLHECRFSLLAAVAAAYGRVIGEVGVAMILGGNIEGVTRTMTTAIALETSKGEFAVALALGMILMAVSLGVNLGLRYLQGLQGLQSLQGNGGRR
jgi:tungstate transport system permease protein